MNRSIESMQVNDQPITSSEQHRLGQCEAIIERGLKAFIEVGEALLEIKTSSLYKQTHQTFEAYCQARWNIGVRQSQRYIQASQVIHNLRQSDQLSAFPYSEYQVRPLTSLPPDKQRQVWQEVIAENKPITGKLVKEKVKDFKHKTLTDNNTRVHISEALPRNKLYHADCLHVLKHLPDHSIDLLLQDPPYNITQNDWDEQIDLETLWQEWERVIKKNGAIIFTATQPFASHLILSNQEYFRYDLIWHKPLGSGFLNAHKMPLRNHEHILVFYKELPIYNPQKWTGTRKKGTKKANINGPNYGDCTLETGYSFDYKDRYPNSIITVSNGNRSDGKQFHPTQKPVELFQYLIRTYTNEHDLVFDGYGGGGTTAMACIQENRDYIVCEKDKTFFETMRKRIHN